MRLSYSRLLRRASSYVLIAAVLFGLAMSSALAVSFEKFTKDESAYPAPIRAAQKKCSLEMGDVPAQPKLVANECLRAGLALAKYMTAHEKVLTQDQLANGTMVEAADYNEASGALCNLNDVDDANTTQANAEKLYRWVETHNATYASDARGSTSNLSPCRTQ